MSENEERKLVLEMVESGKISAEEGLQLLSALKKSQGSERIEYSAPEPSGQEEEKEEKAEISTPNPFTRWKHLWWLPLSAGIALFIGSWWMIWGVPAGGIRIWGLTCLGTPLLLLSLFLFLLAWSMHWATWMHIRVLTEEDKWPRKIILSFPLPLHLIAWFLKNFGHWIPNLDATGLDEVILALAQDKNKKAPFYVEVNDEDDDSHVQVFIG
ncbi:MAG: hypothetical protein AB1345_08030 [Chloroflexota bacterium]